jgi:hypothetical protein
MATKTKKTTTRKSVAKKTATPRMRLLDTMKLRVVGKHTRRKGSRYYGQYELARKCSTVGAFYAKKGEREVLRAMVAGKYARVA